jgi:hypothetical protein
MDARGTISIKYFTQLSRLLGRRMMYNLFHVSIYIYSLLTKYLRERENLFYITDIKYKCGYF